MNTKIKAKLILENGSVFHGFSFGYSEESVGEVVFTTGMTGYTETLTDPSYAGQILTFTYPLIGNYGINLDDMESKFIALRGIVVREVCDKPNNWRQEMDLDGFLKQNKIVGIMGVDTRALTRTLRTSGTMKGIITTKELTEKEIEKNFVTYDNTNIVEEVTTKEPYIIEGDGTHITVIDFGIKAGILKGLNERGCKLSVVGANVTYEDIKKINPKGIFLSNGPGDPENLPNIIELIKKLKGEYPLTGICLGHQLISLANGCTTKRLKFGHHGCNQPVKKLDTGRVYITSQNHEYTVDKLSNHIEATYINLNDGTIEGIKHKTLPIWSVQFHPEAAPGPLDCNFLFDEILKVINNHK